MVLPVSLMPAEPRGKIVLADRLPSPGFENVKIDAPVGHPVDGRIQFVRVADCPRVERHGDCLHEVELMPRPGPGDHGDLAETVIDDLERRGPQLLHGGKQVGIDHPETLGQDLVAVFHFDQTAKSFR